jgi:HPt (histidine-containing phosphotransfer) domain-containing protein
MDLFSMLEAQPSSSTDNPPAPVLDANSLDQLRQLDPSGGSSFLVRVLGTYARSLEKHVAEARQARDTGQWDHVARAAHTLKSASASVGALAFSQVCAEVEHRIRRHELALIEPQVERFFHEAARVRDAVQSQLGLAAS